MNKIRKFTEKYYVWIILFLIAVSFARPIYENTKSFHLMRWDNWNFVVMAKLIKDNKGVVPRWDNLQGYPDGAPFLYPPLVPFVIAWVSILTKIDIYNVVKFMGFLFYPILIMSFIFLARIFSKDKTIQIFSVSAIFAVSQVFFSSLSSPAQAFELILIIITMMLFYKERYYLAIVPFSLMFFTHFFTPFLFGLGAFIYSFLNKKI